MQQLYEKKLTPPYCPVVANALDTSHFDPIGENDRVVPYTGPQKLFEGF